MLIFTTPNTCLMFGWIFKLHLDQFAYLIFVVEQFYEYTLAL